ncbi:hypothetical protein [Asanoa siamensis]|uniref:hypothetical protein n=1 Tax=Asanoa siamensis TaxID=926357 RepID=UPI001944511C|nr:hypothetical protein [Asanoa siamensis]
MKRLIATSPAVLGGIAAVTLVAGAGAAFAAWRIQSDEVVLTAETATLSPGNKPQVSAKASAVTVAWTPNTFGERKVDSYRIKRYDLSGAPQQPRGSCEENVAKETCTDAGVPVGSWRYTVVPVKGGWTGPESAKSDAVLVSADGQAVVVPDPTVDKPAGPAAGPAIVQVGDPGTPAAPPEPGAPATWTLQPGADGVLGTRDTLTYAGGDPIAPGKIIEGWSGKDRAVTVTAEPGRPNAVLTVDDGNTRVFGPLAVPGGTVPAAATFDATLTGEKGRIVVTLGAVRTPPAPTEEATTPTRPETDPTPTEGTVETPGTQPSDPSTPDTPTATESAGTGTGPVESDPPAGGGGDGGGTPAGDGTPSEPETPAAIETTGADTPSDAEVTVTPTASGDPATVIVAAT